MARPPAGVTVSGPRLRDGSLVFDVRVTQAYIRSYATYLWAFA